MAHYRFPPFNELQKLYDLTLFALETYGAAYCIFMECIKLLPYTSILFRGPMVDKCEIAKYIAVYTQSIAVGVCRHV